MLFHPDKCKVMEITRAKNKDACCPTLKMEKTESSDRHISEYSELEKDLGNMVASNLKSDHQVANAVAKASMALSLLRKTFKC